MIWKLAILFMLMLPTISAAAEVQFSENNLTWTNISLMDQSIKQGYQINLQGGRLYYFRAKNESSNYTYTSVRTRTDGERSMSSWSITFFFMAINAALFILPFRVNFSEHPAADYAIKRCCWIIACILTWWNTLMMLTLSNEQGLGLNEVIRPYFYVFTLLLFLVVFALLYTGIMMPFKIMEQLRLKKMMGEIT